MCSFLFSYSCVYFQPEERLALLRKSAERHQQLYRDAMCGQGIDRHLFALYVVLRYLEEESPFMNKVMPPTYLLSTSQTPMSQCEEEAQKENLSPKAREKLISAGGGFGPVADKGYGVSYIIAGENQISFHISSKRSADNTVSCVVYYYYNIVFLFIYFFILEFIQVP